MKVMFDHQIFSSQKTGGISRYFYNLIQYIQSFPNGIECEIPVKYSENVYLKNGNKSPDSPPLFLKKDFKGKKYLLERINRFYTVQRIKENDFNLFFPTYYNTYFLNYLKKPYVLTVHDMTHELFPEVFKKHNDFTLLYKKKAIENASHLIAISENTKKDLLELYNIPEEKISVIHHGIEPTYTSQIVPDLPKRYFLFVGERGGYKNFDSVIKALASIENKDICLMCTNKEFSKEEIKLLQQFNLFDRVKSLSLSDSQLNYLYKNAIALIYPSFYEGFGYPLLEAMRAECLVLSSNSSCLPEIGGDAAHYFAPHDIEELISKLELLLNMSKDEKTLWVEKGLSNLRRFSLEKSMKKTISILTETCI
jgi:glycosyltransferase involved in cell wall biosynthesis